MKIHIAVSIIVAWVAPAASFSSVVQDRPTAANKVASNSPQQRTQQQSPLLFGEEINLQTEIQMEKLRARDAKSRLLSRDELDVVYEDDDILIVNKPSGILSVPTREQVEASLSESVFKAFGCEMNRADMMVVHRLNMDCSGVMVFVKTKEALKGMNKRFETRKVNREYIALVCGHMAKDSGVIDLPIMRDYVRPPFMRISSDDHQRKLIDLESNVVGKKILEMPKESITRYRVIAREELDGQPVTRVALTSVSGRTHQLNVHMAAIGHPIVGDKIYGYGGDALPNGGLTDDELREVAPSSDLPNEEVLKRIAVMGKPTCIHASSIGFRHPTTKMYVEYKCDAPF